MRTFLNVLLSIPAVLSALVLAAHFLRAQQPALMGISLLVVVLVCLPWLWARRVAQVMLMVGALEWVRTTMVLVDIRQSAGLPWQRMAMILGGVAVFTVLSALPLALRRGKAEVKG